MHNKSFTVDNLIAVVGRNIDDEYFEAGTGLVDLDVIAIGDAVKSVSAEFDLFWNSPSAPPAKMILAGATPEAIANTQVVKNLVAGTSHLEWTTAKVVNDDPEKTLSPSERSDLQLLPRLQAAFGSPVKSLDLSSPYFVPGEAGTEALIALAQRGVRVRIP